MQSFVERDQNMKFKEKMIKTYHETIYNPEVLKKSRMRRFRCNIQIMEFEEIHYTIGDEHTNQVYTEAGSIIWLIKN